MKNWLKKIFNRQTSSNLQRGVSNSMETPFIPRSKVEAMVQMIEKTEDLEISCDEVHRLLGQYAEMALRGEDTVNLLPLVHQHLEICPDCREEYDALMQILQGHPD